MARKETLRRCCKGLIRVTATMWLLRVAIGPCMAFQATQDSERPTPANISVAVQAVKADRSWWSLQPLVIVELPEPEGIAAAWRESPIDRFVFARLKELGLKPSPPADRRTIIRRATYDLIGLPPTPDEIQAFLEDKSHDAYEKMIDRLLSSPHYGERWGRHWLDVIRFGESVGFERNVIINSAWPFRDYVIRSFNQDKPFDQFVLEQIAGDVIASGQPEVEVGTAFLVCGPYDNVNNQDPVQVANIRNNTLDDMITVTSTGFLGITVGCARCHDHKFDPVPTEDYYRLQAAFAGVRHGERTLATPEQRKQHEDTLRPLLETKQRLVKQRTDREEAIVRRAEQELPIAAREYKLPKVSRYGTEDRFAPVEARYVRLRAFSQERNLRAATGMRIDEFEVWTAGGQTRNVALASYGATVQAEHGRTAEDFSSAYAPELTIDGKFDACWWAGAEGTLTVVLDRPEIIDRVVFSSDRLRSVSPENPERVFVGEYVIEVSLDGESWTRVADSLDRPPLNDAFWRERMIRQGSTEPERADLASIDRQLAELETRITAVPALPSVWAGLFEQPKESTFVLKGGDPTRRDQELPPSSLSMLEHVTTPYELPLGSPEGERRLALARWLVRRDNPLTARVLANRIWHHHFATGIVDTPSDFGWLGGRPTHPELLDWLARRLHELDWRIKPLHREIMLSQTYRQSSAYREAAARIDKDARFLWRFPPRRLAAEEIRDTMLAIAGMLDRRMGGPGFRLYKYLEDNVATYVPLDQHGPETYRRAVYHQSARASQTDLLTDFDCPDNASPAPTRASTTSPLQTLTLMNHSFTMDMAQCFAERLQREPGQPFQDDQAEEAGEADGADLVRRAFLLAYMRRPSAEEESAAIELIKRHGLAAFCRALLNSNEMIYIE